MDAEHAPKRQVQPDPRPPFRVSSIGRAGERSALPSKERRVRFFLLLPPGAAMPSLCIVSEGRDAGSMADAAACFLFFFFLFLFSSCLFCLAFFFPPVSKLDQDALSGTKSTALQSLKLIPPPDRPEMVSNSHARSGSFLEVELSCFRKEQRGIDGDC